MKKVQIELNKKMIALTQSIVMLTTMISPLALRAQTVERPPQYVMLAFDGSYRNSMWQYLRSYTQKNRDAGTDVRFTFFINPVYLLERSTGLKVYQPPHGNKGSAIGWGDNRDDIMTRINNMNGAFEEGHEIASHAVGHFDGSKWSYSEWKSEMKQFFSILENVFSLNNTQSNKGLLFYNPQQGINKIKGFRAPLLGYNADTYSAISEFGIKYDTSQQDQGMDYWPQKRKDTGIWNFPLARVAAPGTAKYNPTMDYNFCANDSLALLRKDPSLISYSAVNEYTGKVQSNKGKSDCLAVVPKDVKKAMKDKMLATYLAYFNNNYYGNRAPVHIGHHFSPWMGGAYFEAFMAFADAVCSKPEVKCVTYTELQKFVDQKTASGEVDYYRAKKFVQLPKPKAAQFARNLNIELTLKLRQHQVQMESSGKDSLNSNLKRVIYIGDRPYYGTSVSKGSILANMPTSGRINVSAVLLNQKNEEVQTATYVVSRVGQYEIAISKNPLESLYQSGDSADAHKGDF